MEYIGWVQYGIDKGWIDPPACYTHDGVLDDDEMEQIFLGEDPCVFVFRLREVDVDECG